MSFYDFDKESKLKRVEQLVAKDKDGSKQCEKLSDHSPGPVLDEELLARSLEYPNKFDGSGGLNDSLFSDAFTHGASVQRLRPNWDSRSADVHTGFEHRAKVRREGTDGRTPAPDNLYIGAFQVTAAELRACRLENDIGPRVRVYDAGEANDELHAEIMVDTTGLAKDKRKELRLRLMNLAERRGLFVSPHLSQEERARAEGIQCELHLPPTPLDSRG